MSFPNERPLSAPLGDLRSLKPDFQDEGQQSLAGEDSGGLPPPTDSTGFIGNSQQHFPAAVGPPEQPLSPLDVVNGHDSDDRTNNRSSNNIWSKTVKQLHLSEALILLETTSIYEARCQMAAQRADVLILTNSDALLIGILTNKDIAKRVSAYEIDLVNTPVSKVMTKNPIFMLSDTLVVEAMKSIVQERFRQLPVIENGKVIGLVHLLLCLFDEMKNTESEGENYDKVVEAAVHSVTHRGLTVNLLPRDYSIVLPETKTIYEACCEMIANCVDVVVITGPNELFSGLLTTNDIVSRIIPCGFDIVNTPVSKVMKKKPIFVSYDFLPKKILSKIVLGQGTQLLVSVRSEDDGFIYRSLSLRGGTVLPTIQTIAPPRHPKESTEPLLGVNSKVDWDETHGPGLTRYVRMSNSPYPHNHSSDKLVAPPPQHTDVRPSEQSSDPLSGVNNNDEWDETDAPGFTPFAHSKISPYPNNLVAPQQQHTDLGFPDESSNLLLAVNGKSYDLTNNKSPTNIQLSVEEKTMNQMGLSEVLIVPQTITIYEACCQMVAHRADVVVVTDSNELLTGILTNKDIVKRVISCKMDSVNTPVSQVMSKYPSCVMFDTLFVDALKKLKHKSVTQLPVIQKNGKVIGLFYEMEASVTAKYEKVTGSRRGLKVKQFPLEHTLMVPETTTIYEVYCRMAAEKVEVVVLIDSNAILKGILTKKDIIALAIPSMIDLVNTSVSKLMKKNTMFVSSDTLPVKSMQEIMQDVYLDLLVIENGEDKKLLYMPLKISIEFDDDEDGLYAISDSEDDDIKALNKF
ncbi:unnamed protein product [Lactuca saligna]|uniref:CBS domain-containing protein n=1 Tax=Lactuca saligna TaxID=75948 RepID=A0AA36EJ26_LACSI|nr:unnamed protein product [Lactuca saligna]